MEYAEYGYYTQLIEQPHVLIAGSTGSGKSVIINGIIYHLMARGTGLVLIDPKRVELAAYTRYANTMAYADTPADIVHTLKRVVAEMDDRYQRLKQRATYDLSCKRSDEHDIYVIIDELADLMTTSKREVTPLLARLAQLGRAANIHFIAATQRPTRDLVNGQIAVNFDCRVALHCATAQDSRNIIGVAGAETLPRHGQSYVRTPEGLQYWVVPMIAPADLQKMLECQSRPAEAAYAPETDSRQTSTLSRGVNLRDEARPGLLRRLFGEQRTKQSS